MSDGIFFLGRSRFAFFAALSCLRWLRDWQACFATVALSHGEAKTSETVDWEWVWRRLQRAGPTTGGAARGQVSIDAALTAVVCGVSCEAVRRP